MQKLRQRGIWPYLGVLAGLFILSITAPRAWERVVHRAPIVMDRSGRATPQGEIKPAEIAREEKVRQVPQFVRPEPAPLAVRSADSSRPAGEPYIAAPVAKMADPETRDSVAELATRPWRPEAKPDMRPVVPQPELMQPVGPPVNATTGPAATPEMTLPQPSLSISIEPTLPVSAEPQSAVAAPTPLAVVSPAPASQPMAPPPSTVGPATSAAPDLLPTALMQRLEVVALSSQCEPWARGVAQRVRQLTTETSPGSKEATALLADLRQAAGAVDQMAARITDEVLASDLRRAQYALVRRLDIWDKTFAGSVAAAHEAALAKAPHAGADETALASLNGIEVLLSRATDAKPWRDYLMLDALQEATRQDAEARRALARRVLSRLDKAKAAARQRQFIDDAAVASLDRDLRRWATEPVDPLQIVARLEQYERTGSVSDARLVADDRQLLSYSTDADAQELAQKLDENYRNANVRVVIAGDLINRLLPDQKPREEPVYDTILGTPVQGSSTTSTKLFVRLVPDPQALRLGIEASGTVTSQTTSNAGPATFRNQGQSDYMVRKLVVIGENGPHVWPAVADANNQTDLESVNTNYDGVPLVRSLARNIARSQYDQKKEDARREVEERVASTAKARLDAEADPRIAKFDAEVRKRFMTPLSKLELDPSVVSLSTSDKRMVARVRFAGSDQLAAHTPRPQAPSDSLASMQIHQTALNNVLDRLQLDGRTFTLSELYKWIATKFGRPAPELPEDLPEDVTITFAEHDAVAVQCREGQLELTVGIAELIHEQSHFRNFQVRALYRPGSERLQLGLQREGSISLSGERLNMKAQVVLRGIFSRALPASKPISLIPDDLLADPRLTDLAVTQFVVEDGWIGMAIGPRRIAGRPAAERTKY